MRKMCIFCHSNCVALDICSSFQNSPVPGAYNSGFVKLLLNYRIIIIIFLSGKYILIQENPADQLDILEAAGGAFISPTVF